MINTNDLVKILFLLDIIMLFTLDIIAIVLASYDKEDNIMIGYLSRYIYCVTISVIKINT